MKNSVRHINDKQINRRDWLRQASSGCISLLAGSVLLQSCGGKTDEGLTIGVAFDTLQTEYWIASIETMKQALTEHGYKMQQAIADNDANRQLEQINNFIVQQVDGIIIAPKDGQSVINMIRKANDANIPMVIYNRPPAEANTKSVTVVADNYEITKATVSFMVEKAKLAKKKFKGMILIGDLGDDNAIKRRDGYLDVIKQHADIIEDTAQVPTEWDNEKALARMTNALQANPDINFIFSSSDLHLPAIVSVLKTAGKYKKITEENHVMLGSFDGDATAYQMLLDGYLDADGVQDMGFESEQAVKAILELRQGKPAPPIIKDPGLVIHQGNLKEMSSRMWGSHAKRKA